MNHEDPSWKITKAVLFFPIQLGSFLATRILCPFDFGVSWLADCFKAPTWIGLRIGVNCIWGYFSLSTLFSAAQLAYELNKGFDGKWGMAIPMTLFSAAVTSLFGRSRMVALESDANRKRYDDVTREIENTIRNHRPVDPNTAKERAGKEAEDYVQALIDSYVQHNPAYQALHSQLFVFNAAMPNEYSAEVDHILITQRNIFLIETKYKSGVIYAVHDAKEWRTASHPDDDGQQRTGEMRNALLQAKNTAKVLAKEMHLPTKVIPIVSIYGNNVSIVDGPSNVVAADNMINAIAMFERHANGNIELDVKDIATTLQAQCSTDPQALEKHKARAQGKGEQREIERFVQNASID
ncbi:MAG: nuclease-related domain-containing protein [Burkholderiaceae bacterium]